LFFIEIYAYRGKYVFYTMMVLIVVEETTTSGDDSLIASYLPLNAKGTTMSSPRIFFSFVPLGRIRNLYFERF
jgi:hypothetical protein